ncbi:MAG: copper chaperone PCu(A)C [Nitrospiraceae bacterium]|nr:copper chaperone PCu(A)C [Nitrospiraceae bacterium]
MGQTDRRIKRGGTPEGRAAIDIALHEREKRKSMAMKSQVRSKASLIALVVFMVAVILVACQSGPPEVSIKSPAAVVMPGGNAMVFMTIENKGGPDVLTGVSTDIPGATALIHVMKDNHMQHVKTLNIAGGRSTVFKMGSRHIMIEFLPETMTAGSPFTLTMVFEKSGTMQLHLKLEKAPSKAPMSMK